MHLFKNGKQNQRDDESLLNFKVLSGASANEDETQEISDQYEKQLELVEGGPKSLDRIELLRALLEVSCPGAESRRPVQSTSTFITQTLPLFATPVGLLANLCSIIALTDRWRIREDTDKSVPDLGWALAVNSVALGTGCIANICLFLHACRLISAMWGVLHSALLFMVSVVLYMAMIGLAETRFFTADTIYMRSQGYWQGICGSVLYFISSLCLMASFFNRPSLRASLRAHELEISRRQRKLMGLYIMFVGWVAIGAAVAGKLMKLTYADAAYYCVVTTLTIGFGDITPKTDVTRGLSVLFMYVGLILGGLTTLVLFQAFFGATRREKISYSVRDRREEVMRAHPNLSEEEGFLKMRHIVQRTELISGIRRAGVTTAWLAVFWLIGAVIFSRTEHWSYFDGFYFCAVSLSSVGYGDYVVKSNGGRSFFLLWALFSVPTMAAAISDLASLVMTIFDGHLGHLYQRDDGLEDQYRIIIGGHTKMDLHFPQMELWHHLIDVVKDNDRKEYPFSVWHSVIAVVLQKDTLPENFWLSDESPLQIPFLSEKQFILLALLHAMKMGTEKLLCDPVIAKKARSTALSHGDTLVSSQSTTASSNASTHRSNASSSA